MSWIFGFTAFLCLVGIRAANLHVMRDLGLFNEASRKLKHSTYDTDPEFYNERGKRCKSCPAGYHVKEDCDIPETSGNCMPCKEGTDYTEHPNGLPYCLPCRHCKPDEEVVRKCIGTRNTVCRCRNGTYCPLEHPCEVCLICTDRCPEGKILVSPCNATTDIQCADTKDIPPVNASGQIASILVPVSMITLIIICVFVWIKYMPDAAVCKSLRHFQGCLKVLRIRESNDPERDVNEQNEKKELCEKRRLLLPKAGVDLRKFLDIFINHVPFKHWRRFLRDLGVSDNEIFVAEQNNLHDVKEQQFQLLNSWLDRTGMEASANTLLDALRRIDLRGVAEKISDELVRTSQFEYDMED
uniref:Tumor necrosis factor receptor superfamily member 10B-like n=1 Tax=Geotrypetes seraphini TaxID=260995 RepID=A0A6P8R216_GEOSA|nr:tumor necrosis factor receptor superfamily member 10B-like [Geotrypetes seraphini]